MRSRAIASYLAADKVGSKLICAMGHLERLAAWIGHIRIAHEDAACARCIISCRLKWNMFNHIEAGKSTR